MSVVRFKLLGTDNRNQKETVKMPLTEVRLPLGSSALRLAFPENVAAEHHVAVVFRESTTKVRSSGGR